MSISGAENKPLSADPHPSKLANQGLIVLLICHFFVIVLTFRDYGMSWDQAPTREYGKTVVRFYSSFGGDTTARTRDPNNAYLYGGLFEILAPAVGGGKHFGLVVGGAFFRSRLFFFFVFCVF